MSYKDTQKVNVVYIISKGHSGSTLLDLLVSSHPKISGMGEITNFHKFVKQKEEQLCTCGDTLDKCKLWSEVFQQTSGNYIKPLSQDKEFEIRNYKLFQSVSDVDNTKWICDSSKHLGRLEKLLQSDKFNVRILHLIRDGRAVAFSNKKKSNRVDKNGLKDRLKKFRKYNYFLNLFYWRQFNEKIREKYSTHSNYHLIRYEDIVDDVEKEVGNIWRKLGLEHKTNYLQEINHIEHHNIGGNRMRFNNNLEIQKDTEFLDKINNLVWAISTFFIDNTLSNFGYSKQKVNY